MRSVVLTKRDRINVLFMLQPVFCVYFLGKDFIIYVTLSLQISLNSHFRYFDVYNFLNFRVC